MLQKILENTKTYIDSMPKAERKKKGQFFTSYETAVFMASMYDLSNVNQNVSILDPGSGSGILASALIERLEKEACVRRIELTCYETDEEVLPVLKSNLEFVKNHVKLDLAISIVEEDYILSQADDFNESIFQSVEQKKYDFIIGNPPYLRVLRNNPAAMAMPKVVHGAPNLYFLFLSMSIFNLKDDCELVYIIPRSWTSGAYFKKFRDYLFSNVSVEHIHLFVSRDKVFQQEQVLQETMILKVKRKYVQSEEILISSSNSNGDFDNTVDIIVSSKVVISGKDKFVFLPVNKEEVSILKILGEFQESLPSLGMKMKTGIVVDFRQYDDLREEETEETVPLFYSQHIKQGRVHHNPSGKGYDWIDSSKKGLIQTNKNYLFCKRFTAKEEHRRLQCGIYLARNFPQYNYIATQNKINFIDNIDGSCMDEEIVYGLYVILNSTIYDKYYRILNGSTQVNSTEVNTMPIPDKGILLEMGRKLLHKDDLTTKACDEILMEVIHGYN